MDAVISARLKLDTHVHWAWEKNQPANFCDTQELSNKK